MKMERPIRQFMNDTMGNKISEKDGLFDTCYDYEFYDNGKIKTIVSYRKS